MKSLSTLLVTALLLSLGTVSAQEPGPDTFMGVAIGSAFSMPSCATKKRDKSQPCFWEDDYFTKTNRLNQGPLRTYKIDIPSNMLPPIMLGSETRIVIREGQVVAITAETSGVGAQDEILKLLTEKYGPPTEHDIEPLRNGFGQEAEVISVIWRTSRIQVSFFGALETFKDGWIKVETLAETKTAAAEKRAREKVAPKF